MGALGRSRRGHWAGDQQDVHSGAVADLDWVLAGPELFGGALFDVADEAVPAGPGEPIGDGAAGKAGAGHEHCPGGSGGERGPVGVAGDRPEDGSGVALGVLTEFLKRRVLVEVSLPGGNTAGPLMAVWDSRVDPKRLRVGKPGQLQSEGTDDGCAVARRQRRRWGSEGRNTPGTRWRCWWCLSQACVTLGAVLQDRPFGVRPDRVGPLPVTNFDEARSRQERASSLYSVVRAPSGANASGGLQGQLLLSFRVWSQPKRATAGVEFVAFDELLEVTGQRDPGGLRCRVGLLSNLRPDPGLHERQELTTKVALTAAGHS